MLGLPIAENLGLCCDGGVMMRKVILTERWGRGEGGQPEIMLVEGEKTGSDR
jgi:hypothetical protein